MDVIARSDPNFPQQLNDVHPAVKKLFYLGNWQNQLLENSLAIVGTRRMTSYGERMVEKIVPELVDAGVTIVSGFMYGVDQKAHQVCLECGGKTISVLGWGIEYQYDRYWSAGPQGGVGYQRIIDGGGLVLSEWKKEVPALWMFAYRNRIVAGLAGAVLIVEAAEKSGSLITARWATKLGRRLLALPGSAVSSVTAGTNGLIKEGKAEMVTSGSEILTALNFQVTPQEYLPLRGGASNNFQTSSNNQIIQFLMEEEQTVDELAKKLKWPVEKVIQELSILELKGTINSRDGKYYVG